VNGFRNTGICPFDPNVFAEEEFAAADTTDRPQITICDRAGTSGPITDSRGSLEDIFYPCCVSHEHSALENKRSSSDQAEESSASNATNRMPVES
jgi:hypothetical protein